MRNRKTLAAVYIGMGTAMVLGSPPAAADSPDTSATGGGSGGMAPISDAIEEFGQSLCPKLVKPGSDLAAAISEMQGNSGLTPTLTGMVTGLAIQLECPAFMTAVADGKLPEALKQAGDSPAAPLLGLAGAAGPNLNPGSLTGNGKPKSTGHQ